MGYSSHKAVDFFPLERQLTLYTLNIQLLNYIAQGFLTNLAAIFH